MTPSFYFIYMISYTYPYLIFKLKKTRNVLVIDKTAPQITLQGNKETIVCPAQTYKEEGYTALDNYDGDITSKVKRIEEETYITYTIKDTSKNKTTIKRKLIYEDKQPPLLTLQGPTTIYQKVGTTYKEKGYTASDNCDGDLTNNVKVEILRQSMAMAFIWDLSFGASVNQIFLLASIFFCAFVGTTVA